MELLKVHELKDPPKDDPIEEFAFDVLLGLSSTSKSIPAKYLYDHKGSHYFQKITETRDYYPTQCEIEILQKHSGAIFDHCGSEALHLIELGAGDGHKTKILIEKGLEKEKIKQFLPLDISEAALQDLGKNFSSLFPTLEMRGIVADYTRGLKWLSNNVSGKTLVLFLGSSIGNFSPAQCEVFLRNIWTRLSVGDLMLIGFDLKKPIDTMLWAYNDREGYTKKFNFNLLERMNRELGANFDISAFDHFGTYNVEQGAMESFLVSKKQQSVFFEFLNKEFVLKPFEAIHTEFSYKFLTDQINSIVHNSGFEVVEHFLDSKGFFVDTLLRRTA